MLQLTRNFTIACVLGTVILTGILGYLYRGQEIRSLIEQGQSKNDALAQMLGNMPVFGNSIEILEPMYEKLIFI